MSTTDALDVAPEVAAALRDGRPVVALETTLVTHGLPHPEGLEAPRAAPQQRGPGRRAGRGPGE